ncbi:MAG: ParB/RepB/Spo0J family partition protein [Pseudomonadota bacterium]
MATAAKKQTGNRSTSNRSGLGRGLDALLGDVSDRVLNASDDAPPEQNDGTMSSLGPQRTLPTAFLVPDPTQPRRYFNEDALEELANSIRHRGLLQPILVRPRGKDEYQIVAGERRWRAAQRAQLHEVPVVVRELTDDEAAEIALIENVQRVDLNAIEEAMAYQRLADHFGRTQEQIAKAVGKSRSHIANIMRLLTLPERCLDAVRTNEISMGHARALLGAKDPDDLLDSVISSELSVRETEKLVQLDKPTSGQNKSSGRVHTDDPETPSKLASMAPSQGIKDADTRALEGDLAAALGLEVSIDHTKGKGGVLHIAYLNLDQLDEVTKRLMGAGV